MIAPLILGLISNIGIFMHAWKNKECRVRGTIAFIVNAILAVLGYYAASEVWAAIPFFGICFVNQAYINLIPIRVNTNGQ